MVQFQARKWRAVVYPAIVLFLLTSGLAGQDSPSSPSPTVTIVVNSGPTPTPVALVGGMSQQVATNMTASATFDPASVPYLGSLSGPTWQWRFVSATVAGTADGTPQEAPQGSCTTSFMDPNAATTTLNATFSQAGWWVVTVAAAATYTDEASNIWSGEAYQDIAVVVVVSSTSGVSVLPQKSAICAGGIANAVHLTDVMIVVMDASGNPVSMQTVALSVDEGQLSANSAMTDSTGVCWVTLTSSTITQNAAGNVRTGTITGTYQGSSGTGSVVYEAPTLLLACGPDWIVENETCNLDAYASYQTNGVPGHRVAFTIVGAWDALDNPIPLPLVVPPDYNQPTSPESYTDSDGKAPNTYIGGPLPATLLVRAEDQDVKNPPDGPKPKDEKGVHVKKNDKKAVIKVQTGQKGVIGDEVPSTKANVRVHFVTPKFASDIDGPNDPTNWKTRLWLEADTSGVAFADNFEWQFDGTGGNTVRDQPAQCTVLRDSARKVSVKLVNKKTMIADDTMHVWVVWATITAKKSAAVRQMEAKPRFKKDDGTIENAPAVAPRSDWLFIASIEPTTILDTNTDIPELTKAFSAYPPLSPDGGANIYTHIYEGLPLDKSADRRWDMSRQIRAKILSPNTGKSSFEIISGKFYDGLAAANKLIEDYPADSSFFRHTIGTDDILTDSQKNNPYVAKPDFIELTSGQAKKVRIEKGQLASIDGPTMPVIRKDAGIQGNKVECRIQFREFVRLQIGASAAQNYHNWYRISDYKLWRMHAVLERGANAFAIVPASCEIAEDNEGFTKPNDPQP